MAGSDERMMMQAFAAIQIGDAEGAERICLSVVARSPQNADGWLALGTLAYKSHELDKASERLRRALAIRPRDWQILDLLARTLRELRQFEGAAEFARRALAERPRDPDRLLCAATCFLDVGDYHGADKCLANLRKLVPNEQQYSELHGIALLNLGRELAALRAFEARPGAGRSERELEPILDAQLRLYRFADAAVTARRLLSLNGSSSYGHENLAKALGSLGQVDAAAIHWAQACDLSPEPHTTHLAAGHAFHESGLFHEAESEFRQSIEIQPHQGKAFYALFSGRKVTQSDADLVEAALQAKASDVLQPAERKYACFALGKALNDLGDFREAIGHYDEANRIVRDSMFGGRPCAPAEIREPIQQAIDLFSPAFIDEHRDHGSASCLPIFVTGIMRSGTTLLEQIISAHTSVAGAGEQAFWAMPAPRVVDYEMRALRHASLKSAAEEYVEQLAFIDPEAIRVVDKSPANAMNAGLLHIAFPKAKILFVHRNSLDVAMSMWTTPLESTAAFLGDREAIVIALQETERLRIHWRSVLPPSCFMEVAYEDLVLDQESATRKVVGFCGLDWDEACLYPEQNRRSVRTPSFWQVRQKVHAGSLNRYRDYEPYLGAFTQLKQP